MEFISFELSNGIRCVLRPTRSAVAYCGLTINTGSRDESPAEYGMAHFIEHSIFKGTRRRKAFQINSRLENLGGELNAFTTKEETVVHAVTLRKDVAKAIELIADVIFFSTFPKKEIDKEKDVITDEINSYLDSPSERIYDEFEDLLFAGSPLGHNILGDQKKICAFKTADIEAFRERTYNTDQMVFSMVGSVGESRFKYLCEKYLGVIPSNRRRFSREKTRESVPFSIEKKLRTYQSHCLIGYPAYSNTDPQRIPFSLLSNMLGGISSNSLLNIALREKNGFSYNIEANYTPFNDTGITSIYFSTDKDKVDLCMEVINGEIKKVQDGSISARQFSIAKKQFAGQVLISMENNEGNMLAAGKSLLVYNRVESTAELIRRIQNITPEELIETAREVYGTPKSILIYK